MVLLMDISMKLLMLLLGVMCYFDLDKMMMMMNYQF